MSDYRCSKYEEAFGHIRRRKEELLRKIVCRYPRKKNHYSIVSNNNKDCYKKDFGLVYDNKCAYCGISVKLIPLSLFEVDHFSPKSSPTSDNVNNLNNLVLACPFCNSKKLNFVVSDEAHELLHPDFGNISSLFYRDDDFSIRIQESFSDNKDVNDFYAKMCLNSDIKRLDFLLMSIYGLIELLDGTSYTEIRAELYRVLRVLIEKRNLITRYA